MLYQILSAIAFFFSIGGKLLLRKHIAPGYFVWIFSNAAWIVVHFIQPYTNWWQIAMYVGYIILNSHAIAVHWREMRHHETVEDIKELENEWEGEEGT